MTEKRRIPMEEKFMKGDKNISKSKPNDVLYGYLQMISYLDGDGRRFVYKKDYAPSKVEEYFGCDIDGKPRFPKKNVQRAFRVLVQYGYVRETKVVGLKGNYVKAYELPYDVNELFQYIDLETLRFLLNFSNTNVIKVYIFFKYKYFCFGDKFVFTKKMLLEECFGLSSTTKHKSNMDKLNDILKGLRILGLIDWCEYYITNDKGYNIPQRRLLKVSDKVEETCKNISE